MFSVVFCFWEQVSGSFTRRGVGGVFDKLDIAEEGLSSFQWMSAESMWFPGIAENLRAPKSFT